MFSEASSRLKQCSILEESESFVEIEQRVVGGRTHARTHGTPRGRRKSPLNVSPGRFLLLRCSVNAWGRVPATSWSYTRCPLATIRSRPCNTLVDGHHAAWHIPGTRNTYWWTRRCPSSESTSCTGRRRGPADADTLRAPSATRIRPRGCRNGTARCASNPSGGRPSRWAGHYACTHPGEKQIHDTRSVNYNCERKGSDWCHERAVSCRVFHARELTRPHPIRELN